MSVTQKMFASSGFMLVVMLAAYARAVPVPMPEETQPAEYRQFVSAQVMAESADEPTVVHREVQVDPAVVRPVRSASPFLGIFGSYERPYKSQQHHHHHHHEEHEYEHEYEPEYHHRPQYHKPQHHHQQQRPQHHGGGGGAGSYASAGSFSGGHGGGNGHSQSAANSQSASFGFGPFQASYSASAAHSGSHSDGGFSEY